MKSNDQQRSNLEKEDQQVVLGIIFLLVAIVSLISFIRQLKIKNLLALGFSLVAFITFGFFSTMTITCELLPNLGICGG